MKKLLEIAFIGTAAFVSGALYEQGRKAGKSEATIDPKAWAGAVGSRISRKVVLDLIGKVAESFEPSKD